MADEQSPHEEVLWTAAKRLDLLRCLNEGPTDMRDLRDDLGKSRSTVYKATRELETVRVVESSNEGYRLTLFGRLLLRKFERLLGQTRALWEVEDAFAGLPADVPVDPSVFVDATIVVAASHAPDRAVEELETFVAELGQFRTLTPVHRTRYLDFGREHADDSEFVGEFVLEHDLVEYVISNHADVFSTLLRQDSLIWFETQASLPVGLVLPLSSSSPVGVTLYDENRQLRMFVRTDDPVAAAWAAETYESVREDATRLSPPIRASDDGS